VPNLTSSWENDRLRLMLIPNGFRQYHGSSIASMSDPSRAFELTLLPAFGDGYNASAKLILQPGELTGTATVSLDLKTLTLHLKSVQGDVVEETLRR